MSWLLLLGTCNIPSPKYQVVFKHIIFLFTGIEKKNVDRTL